MGGMEFPTADGPQTDPYAAIRAEHREVRALYNKLVYYRKQGRGYRSPGAIEGAVQRVASARAEFERRAANHHPDEEHYASRKCPMGRPSQRTDTD